MVLDTNVVVSGLLWRGTPRRVIDALKAVLFESVTSEELVDELRDTLAYKKLATQVGASGLSASELVQQFGQVSTLVASSALPIPVCADPDDDAVLACAVAANADIIVSGDKHLLSLGSYAGIPIITAAELLARLGLP